MPAPATPLDEQDELLSSVQKLLQTTQRVSMRLNGVQPDTNQPKHRTETTLKPYKLVH